MTIQTVAPTSVLFTTAVKAVSLGDAQKYFNRAVDAAAHRMLGNVASRAGDLELAIDHYNAAESIEDGHVSQAGYLTQAMLEMAYRMLTDPERLTFGEPALNIKRSAYIKFNTVHTRHNDADNVLVSAAHRLAEQFGIKFDVFSRYHPVEETREKTFILSAPVAKVRPFLEFLRENHETVINQALIAGFAERATAFQR